MRHRHRTTLAELAAIALALAARFPRAAPADGARQIRHGTFSFGEVR